jgi:hypothetical protein
MWQPRFPFFDLREQWLDENALNFGENKPED